MRSRAIVTAEEMRAAEARTVEAGTSVEVLMDRAGIAAAEAIRRFAGPLPALVLCGPGNNGGDGYVIARTLKERGVAVRVAALRDPRTPAAAAARARWGGEAETLQQAAPAPLLIDALFGTGLTRGLDVEVAEQLLRLAAGARVRAAIDLPSGAATDDGRILSEVPRYDLTVTFAALKPSHLLQPAARHMGRVVVADIGVAATGLLGEIGPPELPAPGPDDHKYMRGYVAVLGGEMPGASALAAAAAAKAGAGYVRLVADRLVGGLPHAVVQNPGRAIDALSDRRVGCVAVGPGLGRGDGARELLGQVLAAEHPLVLDADALVLLAAGGVPKLRRTPILTPHAGEFAQLFPEARGSKVEQARRTAAETGAVIVLKGADTVVAAPDGRAAIGAARSHWLATAGTGDVLAGTIAAMRARGLEAFEAASAGVWLHQRASAEAGPALLADDLVEALAPALAACHE